MTQPRIPAQADANAGRRTWSISAVIPLYNGAAFIEQTLESALHQTLSADEIIVVDDGSTDGGPDIVRRMAQTHPIRLIEKPNGGQSAARNHGVAQAMGDLIAFLDHDDLWYPNHLSMLVQPFGQPRSTALGWAYSNLDRIDRDGRMQVRSFLSTQKARHPKRSLDDCLSENMFILPSASLIDRRAFLAIGGFDERLSGFEDDDLFLRLFQNGYDNEYIDTALSCWRIFATSSSYRPSMAASRRIYAEKLLRQFPDIPAFEQFHTTGLIVPRFLGQAMADARSALRSGDPTLIDTCIADLEFLRGFVPEHYSIDPGRRRYLITAIIPLYNGRDFIRDALESILTQTLPPDEIIVVDDGSTDDGADIVLEMARSHPIRLLRKPNGGQSSARNTGVKHANGDLIALLDQDDIWYPHHLATLVEPFTDTRPTALGWAYSNLDRIDQDGSMLMKSFLGATGTSHPKTTLMQCLREDMYILPSASLISRKAIQAVGGFDETLSGYEDDDLFLRLFRAGYENVYIDTPLSKWRIYSTSTSYSPRMVASRLIYARKLLTAFPDDKREVRYYASSLIAPRFFAQMMAEYRRSLAYGTMEQTKLALSHLHFIARYLRRRSRYPLMMVLPLLWIRPIAKVLLVLRNLLPSMSRRALNLVR